MTQPFDERTLGAFAALVRAVAPLDYLAEYAVQVVSQNEDGTCDVKPDDARIPPISKVPVRLGAPGDRVKLKAGARATIGFEAGVDQSGKSAFFPVVTGWDSGEVDERTIAATSKLKLKAGVVELGVNAARAVAGVGDFAKVGGPIPFQATFVLSSVPTPGQPVLGTIQFLIPIMAPIVSGSGGAKVP